MNRAGHEKGRFLVHIHMYFGLAEANVLSCLVNGADGGESFRVYLVSFIEDYRR